MDILVPERNKLSCNMLSLQNESHKQRTNGQSSNSTLNNDRLHDFKNGKIKINNVTCLVTYLWSVVCCY